jgi:hypothetical protein
LVSGQEKAPLEAASFSWETKDETTEEAPPTPAQDEAIPEWMKEAGWQPSTGEALESPIIFDQEEAEGEITKGELPDWLKDMAPEGALEEDLPPLGEEDTEVALPWLQEKEPGPSDTIITWLEENKAEAKPESDVEEGAPSVESEPPTMQQEQVAEVTSEDTAEETQTGDEEQIPTWLADLEQAKEKPSGITDWLRSSATPVEPAAAPISDESVSSIPPDLADQDAALAWLESLAVQHGAKEEELITRPEERLETPPDWVQERGPTETQPTEPGIEEPTLAASLEAAEEPELPDWLQDMTPAEEPPPSQAAEIPEQLEAAQETELPDWLSDMAPSEEALPQAAAESPIIIEPAEESELPDWLSELAPSEEALPQAATESPVTIGPAEESELPDWLNAMAPAEETIPSPVAEPPAPTEDAETAVLPDWLLDIAPEGEELPPTVAEVPEQLEAAEEAGFPGWLSELESKDEYVSTPGVETHPASAEETPAWLEEIEAAIPDTPTPTEVPAAPATPDLTDQDAALAWLESLAVQHGAKEEELITRPEERLETPPDWVQESTGTEIPSEGISPVAETEEVEQPGWVEGAGVATTSAAETLDWLKEEEAPLSEEPATPAEELPAWLQDMKSEEAAPEPISEAPVERNPSERTPTWLQEMTEGAPRADQ